MPSCFEMENYRNKIINLRRKWPGQPGLNDASFSLMSSHRLAYSHHNFSARLLRYSPPHLNFLQLVDINKSARKLRHSFIFSTAFETRSVGSSAVIFRHFSNLVFSYCSELFYTLRVHFLPRIIFLGASLLQTNFMMVSQNFIYSLYLYSPILSFLHKL